MQDKKQLIMLGALAAVLLGVGAFQFTRGSGEEQAQPVASSTPAVEAAEGNIPANSAETKPALNLVSGNYAARDPFQPIRLPDQIQQTPTATAQPPFKPTAIPQPQSELTGQIAPFPVAPQGEALPGVTVTPTEPQFSYRLTGVILGAKPAAVLVDSEGAQRLVPVGSSIDGDSRILDVQRGSVTVRFNDKTLKLTLGGGDASAN